MPDSLPNEAGTRASPRELRARASGQRSQAFGWFLLASIYAVFCQQLATRTALALAAGPYIWLVNRGFYVLLLMAGFAALAAVAQGHRAPLTQMGLPRRPGFGREWALGAALGWAGVVACVLPVALTGGLIISAGAHNPAAFGMLLVDLLTLLLATLADEILFHGYPFQRLIEATGPTLATILVTLLFTLGRGADVPSTPGSILSTLVLGFVLATAYLRTRALWVGWGLHFAWSATTAVLFGLPVGGLTQFSPVISTYSVGPAWLTGGGYGPEGSAVAVLVLLGLFVVTARATRDLRHRWAMPEIVGAGMPVDIDAISKRQHEQGMGPGAALQPTAPSSLVQIAPAAVTGARETPEKPADQP